MLPIKYAEIANPHKYPPVGPNNTPGPDFPAEKTGKPIKPNEI